MSSNTSPFTAYFNTLVEAQRGMSPAETYAFLTTGEVPDLSQPPAETTRNDTEPIISESDARTLLSGRPITAGAFTDFFTRESLHNEVTYDDVMFDGVRDALVAAGKWKASAHPRDRRGRFIEKGAVLDLLTAKKPTVQDVSNAVDELDESSWQKLTNDQQTHIKQSVAKLPAGSKLRQDADAKLSRVTGETGAPNVPTAPAAPTIQAPAVTPSGKSLTPATIYKKHENGAIVAESADGNQRMRWDADRKKFIVENQADGGWAEESALSKSAAYADVKNPDKWYEPTKTSPEVGTSESSLAPETSPVGIEPTASEVPQKPGAEMPELIPVDEEATKEVAPPPPPPPPQPKFTAGVNPNEQISMSDDHDYKVLAPIDAVSWFEEAKIPYGEWTTDEKNSLNAYTKDSGYINSLLRGDETFLSDKPRKNAERIQQAMRPSLKPVLLHRGTDFNGVNGAKNYEDLEKMVGQTWQGDGFFSTSVGGDDAFGPHQVILNVEAPPGTPMAWVGPGSDPTGSYTDTAISWRPDENEMILATGLHYKLTSVSKNTDGKPIVTVRVVPDPIVTTPQRDATPEIPKQANAPSAPAPAALTAKTPIVPTKAVYVKGIADGDVIAESALGDQRWRWNASQKKFALETRGVNGEWSAVDTLNKNATYQKLKTGEWFQPADASTAVATPMPATPTPTTSVAPAVTPVTVPEFGVPELPMPITVTPTPLPTTPVNVTPPLTPSVPEPADLGTASQKYDGPSFQLFENVDTAAYDDYRKIIGREIAANDLAMVRSADLRKKYPEKYSGWNAFELSEADARTELKAEGVDIPDPADVDAAYEKLYQSLSGLSSAHRKVVFDRVGTEARVENALANFSQRHNLGPITLELKNDFGNRVRAAWADKKIAMRVTPSNLGKILADGRVKTQFETGTSKGLNDKNARAAHEAMMFGLSLDPNVDRESRPVYGYVAVDGIRPVGVSVGSQSTGTDALSQYGQVQVVLKNEVRDRTTAMYGDSMNHGRFGLPSPVNQPSWMSFTPMVDNGGMAANFGDLDRDPEDFELRSNAYVEAQVHGGVTVDDIAEVVFPSAPAKALRESLDAQGIPWRVLTLEKATKSADESEAAVARRYAEQQRDFVTARIAELTAKISKYQSDGKDLMYYEDSLDTLKKLNTALKSIEKALGA